MRVIRGLMRGVRRHMRITILMVLLLTTSLANSESDEDYWNNWHQHSEKVSACDSINSVVGFLENALENIANAERTQANSKTIEELIIGFPDCFCNALVELPGNSRTQIKLFFLKSPLFHEKVKIDKALFSKKISKQCHTI